MPIKPKLYIKKLICSWKQTYDTAIIIITGRRVRKSRHQRVKILAGGYTTVTGKDRTSALAI